MAAEIRPFFSGSVNNKRLELVSKLENHNDVVNHTILLRNAGGVISTSEDKSVIIWLIRENNKYWPSKIIRTSAAGTVMCFNHENRILFVGMDNGLISQYQATEDFNDLKYIRSFHSHMDRITGLFYSQNNEWLLSISKDHYFIWHCTKSGRSLGSYLCNSACTALQYDIFSVTLSNSLINRDRICQHSFLKFDPESRNVFIGDVSGAISMLKFEDSTYKLVTKLNGHSDAIRCLEWDPSSQMLFSGGSDKVIICWDIGGKKGTVYELQGHGGKVTALCYLKVSKLLLSSSDDGKIMIWRMDVKRKETPSWEESDNCQRCRRPFFWNIKAMVDQKTIGLRQHHCRCCGKAVCAACSNNQSSIATMGFELQVRICDECFNNITEEDIKSLATCFDSKHSITHMDSDESKAYLLTSGTDRMIKLWDLLNFVNM